MIIEGIIYLESSPFWVMIFKPRLWNGGIVFTPGIGSGALKMIRSKIKKEWNLRKEIMRSGLEDIARKVNPIIRGWVNYYGHHRRSELYKMSHIIDNYLVQFLKKKYKKLGSWGKAGKRLSAIKRQSRDIFCHWHMISSK